jgi:hypothetical protein
MKKRAVISLLLSIIILNGISQNAVKNFGIKFSGYVKTDIFYDTRQSCSANAPREGYFYLYPDDAVYDVNGNDVNASPSFHMLSIQSRLKGDITGPDAFGATTSGVIEAEFFGTSESDLNGFRLRHAYMKMDWNKTTLLIGQYWHPMFQADCFPGTISFNTGAPFTPFSRNPQVRLTKKVGATAISITAYSQRDFVSSGPDGNSNKYLRNSGLPAVNFQLRVTEGEIITGWAGIDLKRLKPEIRTSTNAETNATIESVSTFATLKIRTKPLSISLMGIYGQNVSDLVMIGGYAVSEITDPVNQFKTYSNLNTASYWADLTTNGKKVAFGLFTAFSKNLGAGHPISGTIYGRGNNIDHLFRVSPRVTLTEGSLSFAMEFESTTAAYGTIQNDGKVDNTNNITNMRILLSSCYKF